MTVENPQNEQGEKNIQVKTQGGSSDAVYGLGVIGAWVYFIGRSGTFQEGLSGFFKGIFWPAILVYELFLFLEKD